MIRFPLKKFLDPKNYCFCNIPIIIPWIDDNQKLNKVAKSFSFFPISKKDFLLQD